MRSKLAMGELWRDTVTVARAKLAPWDASKAAARTTLAGLVCPSDLAALTIEDIDPLRAAVHLQVAMAAGSGA
jgi:hypothetical protein